MFEYIFFENNVHNATNLKDMFHLKISESTTFVLFFVFFVLLLWALKLCENFLRQLERLASYDYEKIRKVGGVERSSFSPRKSCMGIFFVNRYICHVMSYYPIIQRTKAIAFSS